MNFEEILSESKNLSLLINEKKINTFTSLPKKSSFSNEFIDWLSPKYYDVFVELFDIYVDKENKSPLIKLINSDWYCNQTTTGRIIDFIKPYLDQAQKDSEEIKKQFSETKDVKKLVELTNTLEQKNFNYLNKALFNVKNSEIIKSFKDNLVGDAISICNDLKEKKITKDIKNTIIVSITEMIEKITLNKEQNTVISQHKSDSNTSLIISVIIGALLAAFALFRLISKFT